MAHEFKNVIIFGGSGFIGSFLSRKLYRDFNVNNIFIYDLVDPTLTCSKFRNSLFTNIPCVKYINGDVRDKIKNIPELEFDLVINLAAIHREPGHRKDEYYETNIKGAENITAWCEEKEIKNLIFTSSISPYGVSEDIKNESSIPMPVTPYGSSKLVAEKIHQCWHARKSKDRKLIIVRPGVVYGPGENGNVTRLIKAVKKNYFIYTGNKETRKAGIYVKELCASIFWVYQNYDSISVAQDPILFNGCSETAPSVHEYILGICSTLGKKKFFLTLPYSLLLISSYFITAIANLFKINHPFSPMRIKKLVRSNFIEPKVLKDFQYKFNFSLEDSLKDWKQENSEEWGS